MVRLKGNLPGLLLAAAWLAIAGPLAAQDAARVVLLEDSSQPPRTGLSQALGIQLIGRADVDVRQVAAGPGVSERVAAASELAQAPDVLVVVWAEPTVARPDGSSEAVLYVVGHKQGRALVEIVRVEGGDGPDVDRSLALKVREVVDEVVRNRERAEQAGDDEASDLMLEPAAGPPPKGWGAVLAAAVAVGPLSGLGQWGARIGGGPGYRDASLRLSALAELAWFPAIEAERRTARVEVQEFGPALSLRAQLRRGRVWLGVRAGAGLSFVAAEAVRGRETGRADVVVGSVLTGIDVEVPIDHGVGLCVGLELQTRLPRQRFAVAGESLVDLGRVRPLAQVALTWSSDGVR